MILTATPPAALLSFIGVDRTKSVRTAQLLITGTPNGPYDILVAVRDREIAILSVNGQNSTVVQWVRPQKGSSLDEIIKKIMAM